MPESYGLTFHHVSKVYGTNQVVRDLDFSIKAGEWLVDGFYVERSRENPLPAYAGPFPLSGGHKKTVLCQMLG